MSMLPADAHRRLEAPLPRKIDPRYPCIPFKVETWPEDADGDPPTLCTGCGEPVRYGSRHSPTCGSTPV